MTVALPGPSRLTAVVEAVVEAHPYAVSGHITPSERLEVDAGNLWARLTPLRGPALVDAVDVLNALEVRILLATARRRLAHPPVLDVLGTLLERRHPDGAGALAWDVFLLTDGHPIFRRTAQEYLQQHATERPLWASLARRGKPSDAALALYHGQSQALERWVGSPSVALDSWPDLVRRMQIALLTPGALARLDRHEPAETIERWVQVAVPPGDREAWYAAFLEETRTSRRPLDHAVLRAILERFGNPASGRPFWSGVSEAARRAFELWLMDGRLTQLLGEGDRVEFWRRFLPQIKRPFHNRDGHVVFVDLGVAVAVQFVNDGTATYLFSPDAFRSISLSSEARVRRSVYDNSHRSLASYEHRGSTWQWTAEATVRRLLTELAHA